MADIWERLNNLNINLSEKTEAVPFHFMEIFGISRFYLNSIEKLVSDQVDNNKRLFIKIFDDIYVELYIHLAYHLKSLKKALYLLKNDLEKEFGREILSKSINISNLFDMKIIGGLKIFSKASNILDTFDMATTGQKDNKFDGDLKIRLFQSGDKLVGDDPVVMFFKGKDWKYNLLIEINENPNKIRPVSRTTLGLHPRQVRTNLIKVVKKYRMAFIKFWNTPSMTTDELKELINIIDSE
jgi:hypothetical protein